MQLIVFAYDLCRILDCLIKKKNSSSNSFLNSAWKFDMKLLAGTGNTGKNTVKRFDTGLSLESTEIHDGLRPNIGSCFPRLPWSSQCRSSLSLLYYVLWEFCCLKLMSPLSLVLLLSVSSPLQESGRGGFISERGLFLWMESNSDELSCFTVVIWWETSLQYCNLTAKVRNS